MSYAMPLSSFLFSTGATVSETTILLSSKFVTGRPDMSDTLSTSSSSPTSFAPDESASVILAEKGWLQGALISAVAYGGELVLFAMCCYLLVNETKADRSSIRKNGPLLAYISLIVVLGTLFMGSLAKFTQLAFIENRNYPGGPSQYETDMFSIPVDEMGNVAFVLGNWLCDLLIVWRCMVIYRGCRLPLWLVMFFPCLLFLGSFTMGLLWLLQISASSPFESSSLNWTVPYFTLSLSLNIFVTIAIVARLLVYRHRVASVLGRSHGNHYTSIAAMVVESAAIYSVFSLLFLVPFAINSLTSSSISQIFLQSMGQVQVIATLLIVFRVAQGKGWSNNTQSTLGAGIDSRLTSKKAGGGSSAIRMTNFTSRLHLQSQGSGASTTVDTGMPQVQKNAGILISQEVLTMDSSSVVDSKRVLRPDEEV